MICRFLRIYLLRYTLICCLAFLALGCLASADDVITLNLDTPELHKSDQSNRYSSTKVTTSTARASERQKIGRLGLVSSDRASIYSRRSSSSRVYSVCLKDVPLAVVKTSGSWYGVMMVDGSTGWIPSSKVRLLDYQTVLPKVDRSQLTYRGGYGDGGGNEIVQTALQYLGVPYVWGGTSTSSGMDCSAFVRLVYSKSGVDLPRVSRDQANVGESVSIDEIQPGDRLYFACKHSYVDHCGIYIGNGYFIHASASRGGVAVDNLNKKFYANSLFAIMR